jgi:glycosyltransferase involved in cell wall biosynthesis
MLSVLIPCYNEAATVGEVVRRVRAAALPDGWTREIIVVDDGSGPETRAVLKTLEHRARVVYRERNGGKGAAVKEGLARAAGDYCIVQDADLELDPDDYGVLAAPIAAGDAEVAFGYRVIANGASPALFYGGRLLSLLFNAVFLTALRDIPSCYKLFPRAYIPALRAMPSDDFVFDAIEMTYVLGRGARVAQVPVRYYPRTHSAGKKLRAEDGMKSAVAILLVRTGLYRLPIAREIGRIARFLISGALTVLVNLAVLYAVTEYGHVWYLTSSVIAFCVSYVVNFGLQKFWTFRHAGLREIRYQLPLHLTLAIANLALNTGILFALVEWFHIWYVFAQVIAAIIIAIDSFVLSKKIFAHPHVYRET